MLLRITVTQQPCQETECRCYIAAQTWDNSDVLNFKVPTLYCGVTRPLPFQSGEVGGRGGGGGKDTLTHSRWASGTWPRARTVTKEMQDWLFSSVVSHRGTLHPKR